MTDSPRGKIGILIFHRCINYGSYWQAARLAIEVDGPVHKTCRSGAGSRKRNILLEERLGRILRLPNDDILNRPDDAVARRIPEAAEQAERDAPPFGARPACRR